jgi:hypothetical protein
MSQTSTESGTANGSRKSLGKLANSTTPGGEANVNFESDAQSLKQKAPTNRRDDGSEID